jgi:hypothetical protein
MKNRNIIPITSLLGLAFALLAIAGCVNPHVTVTKIPPGQTGGKYSISGTGFGANDTLVRLEIQNVPLYQPDTWQLGTAPVANGNFSFQTQEFRCRLARDPQKRNQQITFVATGVTSHYSASGVATASDVIICP